MIAIYMIIIIMIVVVTVFVIAIVVMMVTAVMIVIVTVIVILGLRYYLNKNRCVTGNIRAISSWLDTTPQVPRVNVLAVNKNCSDIYYHSVREGWVSYDRNHFDIHECQ